MMESENNHSHIIIMKNYLRKAPPNTWRKRALLMFKCILADVDLLVNEWPEYMCTLYLSGSNTIFCYDKDDKKIVPKSQIDFSTCDSIEIEVHGDRIFSLTITCRNKKREYFFSANDSATMSTWVQALKAYLPQHLDQKTQVPPIIPKHPAKRSQSFQQQNQLYPSNPISTPKHQHAPSLMHDPRLHGPNLSSYQTTPGTPGLKIQNRTKINQPRNYEDEYNAYTDFVADKSGHDDVYAVDGQDIYQTDAVHSGYQDVYQVDAEEKGYLYHDVYRVEDDEKDLYSTNYKTDVNKSKSFHFTTLQANQKPGHSYVNLQHQKSKLQSPTYQEDDYFIGTQVSVSAVFNEDVYMDKDVSEIPKQNPDNLTNTVTQLAPPIPPPPARLADVIKHGQPSISSSQLNSDNLKNQELKSCFSEANEPEKSIGIKVQNNIELPPLTLDNEPITESLNCGDIPLPTRRRKADVEESSSSDEDSNSDSENCTQQRSQLKSSNQLEKTSEFTPKEASHPKQESEITYMAPDQLDFGSQPSSSHNNNTNKKNGDKLTVKKNLKLPSIFKSNKNKSVMPKKADIKVCQLTGSTTEETEIYKQIDPAQTLAMAEKLNGIN